MLRSSVRCVAFGVISLLTAGLVLKRLAGPAQDRCRLAVACGDCAALAGCRLPRALAVKKLSRKYSER